MHGIISGILFIASIPPFNLYEAGLFALVPVFIHAIRFDLFSTLMQSLYFGLIIGAYCFFGIFSYEITPYIACIVLFMLIFIFFICASWVFSRLNKMHAFLAIPGIWILIELTLAEFNIPIPISILVTDSPVLMFPASYGGQYLLSILLIGTQYGLSLLYIRYAYQRRMQAVLVTSSLVVFLLLRLYEHTNEDLNTSRLNSVQPYIRVAVVQTNLHPLNTLNIAADRALENIQSKIDQYTRDIRELNEKPQLIVWPELSAERFEFRNPGHAGEQAALLGIPMLVPSPDLNPDGSTVNALFAVSGNGRVLERQIKSRLIPYFESKDTPASSQTPLYGMPGSPGTLICFESAFSDVAIEMTRMGAEFIVISTNDAYAGPSFLSLLHEALARLRAVENSRTVLRAANGGPSSLIDRYGRFISRSGMYRDGIMTANIAIYRDQSFYVKYYPWILVFYWTFGIISLTPLFIRTSISLGIRAIPSVRLNTKSLLMSVAISTVCVAYQYTSSRNVYTDVTGDKLPDNFVHFQSGMFNGEPEYNSLRTVSSDDALLSSLTYLLRDYGIHVSLDNIRQISNQIPDSAKPDNKLKDIVTRYGYHFKARTVDIDSVWNVYTPALTQLNTGETVVLKEFNTRSVTFFSPFLGKMFTVKAKAFRKRWLGNLFILLPVPKPWDHA